MDPRRLLPALLLLCCGCSARAAAVCNNRCCRFVEGFPARLRMLRENYSQIRGYYEANDDLDTALLDRSLEESFKTPFACRAMDAVLKFYLDTVLPRALASFTAETKDLQPHVESIQQIFDQLKVDVASCKNYFSCKNPFEIHTLNSTYTQMEDKGLYKAMGELNVLFNYIETYLASKRVLNKA